LLCKNPIDFFRKSLIFIAKKKFDPEMKSAIAFIAVVNYCMKKGIKSGCLLICHVQQL